MYSGDFGLSGPACIEYRRYDVMSRRRCFPEEHRIAWSENSSAKRCIPTVHIMHICDFMHARSKQKIYRISQIYQVYQIYQTDISEVFPFLVYNRKDQALIKLPRIPTSHVKPGKIRGSNYLQSALSFFDQNLTYSKANPGQRRGRTWDYSTSYCG